MKANQLVRLIQTSNDLASPKSRPFTVAALIMDRSSSMKQFGTAPRDALNLYLKDVKACPVARDIAVEIVTFDAKMDVALPMQPVLNAPDLEQIQIGRGTRLDATVRDVMLPLMLEVNLARMDGHTVNPIIAVFTDGYDSHSNESDRKELRQVAHYAQTHQWELLTFGFGVDVRYIASRMGFPTDPEHAKGMRPDAQSVHEAMKETSEHTKSTATGRPWITVEPDPPSSNPR